MATLTIELLYIDKSLQHFKPVSFMALEKPIDLPWGQSYQNVLSTKSAWSFKKLQAKNKTLENNVLKQILPLCL